MLVQCPECTTKYNLDEGKIGHDGSKVRCTRCKNVFTVFRPMPVPEPVQSEPELPAPSQNAGPARDDSFDDDLEALFSAPKSAPASRPVVDASLEDELEALLHERKPQPSPSPSRPAAAKPAGPKPVVDEDMVADLQGAFQQPLIAKPGADPLSDDEPAAKPRKSRLGLVLFLVLLLLAAAGAGVYHFRPALLGLTHPEPGTPAAPAAAVHEGAAQIALENVRQYFVPNEKEGQLFIIEGKAVNRFPEARELIRLKASLFDKQGAEVVAQEFMCGNVVSLYQLQVSTRADIEAALTAKVGILTNNSNIQPGASAPFMVVFFKAPNTVEEFGLEVVQSSAPQQ
jgi:predicted Zn finger-like uncharacterized protein